MTNLIISNLCYILELDSLINVDSNIKTITDISFNNERFYLANEIEKAIKKMIVSKNRFSNELERLANAFTFLDNKTIMPASYHDFELGGTDKQHKGYRHFHVNNDISMIYKITKDKIYLIAMDKHKQVKKNKNKYPIYPKN